MRRITSRSASSPLWDNGVGYVSGHRDALFLLEEKTGEARPITQWPFTVGAYVLTPDKKQVAYSGCSYTQLKPRQKGLYLYDIPSQTTKTILPEGEYRIGKLQMVGETLLLLPPPVRQTRQQPKR